MRNLQALMVLLMVVPLATSTPIFSQASEDGKSLDACEGDVDSCVMLMRKEFTERRGYMGFIVHPAEAVEGLEVRWTIVQVLPDTAASEAGLRPHDIVTAWNGGKLPPGVPEPFFRKIMVGQKVDILINRNGKELVFSPTARKPTDKVVESWLMGYVQASFSKDEFEIYRARFMKRLSSE